MYFRCISFLEEITSLNFFGRYILKQMYFEADVFWSRCILKQMYFEAHVFWSTCILQMKSQVVEMLNKAIIIIIIIIIIIQS